MKQNSSLFFNLIYVNFLSPLIVKLEIFFSRLHHGENEGLHRMVIDDIIQI